jgi:hypothetical protein
MVWCGSAAVALVAFYVWVDRHFAFYYRQRECAWDFPGTQAQSLLVGAAIAVGAGLLFIPAMLVRNKLRRTAPLPLSVVVAFSVVAMLAAGALELVLWLLMGAGMECFD